MAFNNAGIALTNKKQFPEAIAEFKRSLAVDPQNKEAYLNLGNLQLGLGNYEEALAIYLEGVRIDPRGAVLHNNMAVIYFKKGDYEQALVHARKAEELGFRVHPEFLEELRKKTKREAPG